MTPPGYPGMRAIIAGRFELHLKRRAERIVTARGGGRAGNGALTGKVARFRAWRAAAYAPETLAVRQPATIAAKGALWTRRQVRLCFIPHET